jgi:3-methyladenine DNA glycosylase AlkD
MTPEAAARAARGELARWSRPSRGFDARRYFRDSGDLAFYNIGMSRVRSLARDIVRTNPQWSMRDAVKFADALMKERHLEAKGVGVEALARYKRRFTPSLLPVWKGWLAKGYSSNWATTDAICGLLIGPLLVAYPHLAGVVAAWTSHRSLWIRRASAVGLIPLARRGQALAHAYAVAGRLQADEEDLIQKAVGWLLREAGKTDMERLERYLLRRGPRIPRTTVRYAIERFPVARRRTLLVATRSTR